AGESTGGGRGELRGVVVGFDRYGQHRAAGTKRTRDEPFAPIGDKRVEDLRRGLVTGGGDELFDACAGAVDGFFDQLGAAAGEVVVDRPPGGFAVGEDVVKACRRRAALTDQRGGAVEHAFARIGLTGAHAAVPFGAGAVVGCRRVMLGLLDVSSR